MKRFMKQLAMTIVAGLVLAGCQSSNPSETRIQTNTGASQSESSETITSSTSMTNQTNETNEGTTTMEDLKTAYRDVTNQPTAWTERLDDEQFNMAGIRKVRNVGLFTGDASANLTRERYNVGGTDLGIPVVHDGRLYLFFGDSFAGDDAGRPMEGGVWRSNLLAYSDDDDFSDGLRLDGFITGQGLAKQQAIELISSKKVPGIEHTVIPTGAISVDGVLYSYFMSIKEWGAPGQWTINYGGLARSENDGQSFHKLKEVEFDADRFGQIAPIQVGEMIYFIGVGGGRFGDAYLMRVSQDQIEEQDAYEYYAGLVDGEARFSSNVEDSVAVADGPVGEPSIMYNDYLEEYVLTYLDEHRAAIVMRVAKEPWGPYSEKVDMIRSHDYPALYGGFVHEAMTADNGRTFYFTMSMWDPIYNSILFEVEVERRGE